MATLSNELAKRLGQAVTDRTLGEELVTAIQRGATAAELLSNGGSIHGIAAAIVATNVSQTIDFGALKVGDLVAMVPATAGSADLITVAVAGDLGQAAVVGNLYLVLRSISVPAAKVITW